MVHSIQDLMANRYDEEPPEMRIIKDYVKREFNEMVAVALKDQQIIITVRSSSLAGALRPHLGKISRLCKTDKKLSILIN